MLKNYTPLVKPTELYTCWFLESILNIGGHFCSLYSLQKKATFYSKGISTGNVYNIRNYMVTSVTDHKIKLLALVNGNFI